MTFYPGWTEFDVQQWLTRRVALLFGDDTSVDQVLLTPELRRELCVDDPLLFGWVYLSRHLTADDGTISYARPHLEWYEAARDWMRPEAEIAGWRHAFIAPRDTGKSSVWFLIIPAWAMAYGHELFVAAFANSDTQAQLHLASFRRELDTNALLRNDFPDLCAPAVRARSGSVVADRQGMLHARSGAVFAAKGVDSANLGMKVGNRRPGVIVLDDLEPDEARYSTVLKDKRLGTLRDAILPLNIRARVALVGTVTMPDSITHDLVRSLTAAETGIPAAPWVLEDAFTVHHHRPLVDGPDGQPTSIWPQKWPTAWMLARRHTREFAKNYENDPLARDGEFWTSDDFVYGDLDQVSNQLISIDPAVSTRAKSDFTAIAVIAYDRAAGRCCVRYSTAVKVAPGAPLRARVLAVIDMFPDTAGVVVEVNQGGDAWRTVLHDLPIPLRTVTNTAPKEVRATWLLDHYQRGEVLHAGRQRALEAQMVSFPKGTHDDLVDAVGTGVEVFLSRKRRTKAGGATVGYA